MFESWSDVLSGLATAVVVAYAVFAIEQRKKKLRELVDVLEADDEAFCRGLEEMVEAGSLKPLAGAATA